MNDAGAGPPSTTVSQEQDGPRAVPPPETFVDAGDGSVHDGDGVFLHWTPRDRWFFAVLAAVILGLLTIQFVRLSGWGLRPLELERPESRRYEFQLDVNAANWVEWMQLEGVGETTARNIVADRERNGPFRSVDDVARVKGIGPATLEKMRPWLRYEPLPGPE